MEMRRGPITPLQALQTMGIMRLASRVDELRKQGYNILTENVKSNGKTYARYHLMERKNG
jgi:hypothetical protein